MSKTIELLPFWFYLAGSICFLIGTAIVLFQGYQG